ncbi:MAG: prolyl oligopeptidase family serine peptidase, partial [Opitutaceae bacterium]
DVSAKYRVDPSQVYLTGFSMGGFGTWSLGMRYPHRFAAIAPICGGGDLVDIGAGLPGKQPALQSLPIWVFHGGKDAAVPLSESERMIAAVKKVSGNNNVRLTVYPEAGHDSWTETYDNPELYRWSLQHRR